MYLCCLRDGFAEDFNLDVTSCGVQSDRHGKRPQALSYQPIIEDEDSRIISESKRASSPTRFDNAT